MSSGGKRTGAKGARSTHLRPTLLHRPTGTDHGLTVCRGAQSVVRRDGTGRLSSPQAPGLRSSFVGRCSSLIDASTQHSSASGDIFGVSLSLSAHTSQPPTIRTSELELLLLWLLLLMPPSPQEVVPARADRPAPGGPPEKVQVWRPHPDHGLTHGRGGPNR